MVLITCVTRETQVIRQTSVFPLFLSLFLSLPLARTHMHSPFSFSLALAAGAPRHERAGGAAGERASFHHVYRIPPATYGEESTLGEESTPPPPDLPQVK